MVWPFDRREDEIADIEATADLVRRFAEAKVLVTPEMAERVIEYTNASPNADPGLVMGAAMSANPISVKAFSEMADAQAPEESGTMMDWAQKLSTGSPMERVANAVKGSFDTFVKRPIRTATAALETLSEELVQRPLTAAMNAGARDDLNFGEAYKDYGNSIGVNYARSFVNDDVPNGLGSGFFAGGKMDANDGVTSPREFQQEGRTLELSGKKATFGRSLTHYGPANLFFDPGDRTYEFAAGLSQFVAEVVLDPSNLATGGVGGIARAGLKGGAKLGLVDDAAASAAKLFTGSKAREFADVGAAGFARNSRTLDTQWATDLQTRVKAGGMTEDIQREMYGMIQGGPKYRSVIPETLQQVMQNSDVVDALVNADKVKIWQNWSKAGKNRVNTAAIRELGEASTRSEVIEILAREASTPYLTDNRFYSGVGIKGGLNARTSDMAARTLAAEGELNAASMDQTIRKIDSLILNLDTPETLRKTMLGRLLDVNEGDQAALNKVHSKMMTELSENFVERAQIKGGFLEGIDDESVGVIRQILVNPETEVLASLRKYRINELGNPVPTQADIVVAARNGEFKATRSGPIMESQLSMASKPVLPNPMDVRKAIKDAGRETNIYKLSGWAVDGKLARKFSSQVFKPAVLLRPAYISRVMMDEAMRLTVAGQDTIFRNPITFLSTYVLNKNALKDLAGDDVTVHAAAREFLQTDVFGIFGNKSQSKSGLFGTIDRPIVEAGETVLRADQFSPLHVTSWRRDMGQMNNDRLFRQVADYDNLGTAESRQAAVDWLRNTPEGKSYVAKMGRSVDGMDEVFASDDLLRKHLHDLEEDLWQVSNGDREILDMIAGRTVGDGTVTFASDLDGQKSYTAMNRWLKSKAPENYPAKVKTELMKKQVGEKSGIIEALYDNMLKRPMKEFIRIPAWQQEMASVIGDMMPALTPAVRKEVIANLGNLGVSKRVLTQVREKAAKATGPGLIDTLKEANETMLRRSIDNMSDILFDTSTRSGFQEKYDAFVPFGDAWGEALKVWGTLLKDNPQALTRGAALGRAANNSGLIYTNEHGERVFAMPRVVSDSALAGMAVGSAVGAAKGGFGGAFAGAIAGGAGGLAAGAVAEPFTERDGVQAINEFRVQGLNSVTQGVGPGFGPIVQWPVNALMPDSPSLDPIRELISPFNSGPQTLGDLGDPSGMLNEVLPAWFTKVANAVSGGQVDQVQWNSALGEILQVKALTGDYDLSDNADRERMEDDAKRSTWWTMLTRGLSQGVFATGPTTEWSVATEGDGDKTVLPEGWDFAADPDGKQHHVAVLATAHRDLVEELGSYDEANEVFSRLYGLDPYWISARRTQTRTGGPSPSTREYTQVLSGLPQGTVAEFGAVLGYFVPDGEFDYQVYREMFASDEREALSPQQIIGLTESSKARQQYEAFRVIADASGAPSSAVGEAMKQKAIELNEDFPNWQVGGVGALGINTLRAADRIELLTRAVQEPSLQELDLTGPLKEYTETRSAYIAALRAKFGGTSTLARKEAAPLRAALLRLGVQLSQSSTDFGKVWPSIRSDVDN